MRVPVWQGNLGPLVLCLAVTASLKVIDPITMQRGEINEENYFRHPRPAIMTASMAIEYTVLDVELTGKSSGKLQQAELTLARTRDLPKIARERVVPGLCRQAIEAACLEAVRTRRLGRGESHDSIEALFEEHTKLLPRLALALFDDAERAGEDLLRLLGQLGDAGLIEVREGETSRVD